MLPLRIYLGKAMLLLLVLLLLLIVVKLFLVVLVVLYNDQVSLMVFWGFGRHLTFLAK